MEERGRSRRWFGFGSTKQRRPCSVLQFHALQVVKIFRTRERVCEEMVHNRSGT